jgi:hypothetical protein
VLFIERLLACRCFHPLLYSQPLAETSLEAAATVSLQQVIGQHVGRAYATGKAEASADLALANRARIFVVSRAKSTGLVS